MIKLKIRTSRNAEFFCSASGDLSVTGYNILLSRGNKDCWLVAGYGNTYMARSNLKGANVVLARTEKVLCKD